MTPWFRICTSFLLCVASCGSQSVETSSLWTHLMVLPQQPQFFSLPQLPPSVDWFRVSIATASGYGPNRHVELCLRFGAPPLLPLDSVSGIPDRERHYCSAGDNFTLSIPRKGEPGRSTSLRFFALVSYVLGPNLGTMRSCTLISRGLGPRSSYRTTTRYTLS